MKLMSARGPKCDPPNPPLRKGGSSARSNAKEIFAPSTTAFHQPTAGPAE
jgi:hypothetical protein